MAEICVGPAEATKTVAAAAVVLGEASSRAARRRRMEIRRHRVVANADVVSPPMEESGVKRRRVESSCEGEEVSDSSENSRSRSRGSSESGSDSRSRSPSRRGLRFGVTSVCGRRRDMEDAVSVVPGFHGDYHFFGVYDGHGCSHVAETCKNRMHETVAEEIGSGPHPSSAEEWTDVMERSFARVDAEAAVSSSGAPRPPTPGTLCRCELQTPKCDHVGSTAVIAAVNAHQIVVANCGDSRAVLCRDGVAVPLSCDHKPDRPDELSRIEAAGGRVIYWDGARVLGVLAMSRAIGDGYLKPFVTSVPEVTVTERSVGDECLILASDGLWDAVTNEMACYIVRMCLRSSVKEGAAQDNKACADAAILLTKLALARGSMDNVSVVVVDLGRHA